MIEAANAGATTMTNPTPMLKTRIISRSSTGPLAAMSLKIGGTGQELRLMRTVRPGGMTRGRLPGRPPPVMWAIALMTFLTR